MKRLSIIVPIFNVESYLTKCLDSLLVQDIPFNDYEIIIINDGSTDRSCELAKKYADSFQNVKFLSLEKTGVGEARNTGIKESAGKYLLFVDGDDYIKSNCLGTILNCAEINDLDVLRFNYDLVDEKEEVIPKKRNATKNMIFSEKIVDGNTFLSEFLGWACYAWSFIFNASLIKNNKLFFNSTIYFEDVEWLIRVLDKSKRVRSINYRVYNYLRRSGSITQSLVKQRKNKVVSDKLFIVEKLNHFSNFAKVKKVGLWCKGMISLTFMGLLAYTENEIPERKTDVIRFISDKGYLPLHSYHFTLKQKRDMLIINFSPKLYCFLKRRRKNSNFDSN